MRDSETSDRLVAVREAVTEARRAGVTVEACLWDAAVAAVDRGAHGVPSDEARQFADKVSRMPEADELDWSAAVEAQAAVQRVRDLITTVQARDVHRFAVDVTGKRWPPSIPVPDILAAIDQPEGDGMVIVCGDGPLETPPATSEKCVPHTPAPVGYVARAEWGERMSKTHRQVRCPGCGLFNVWVRKEA